MDRKQRQKSQRARHRAKTSQPPRQAGQRKKIWLGTAAAVAAVLAVIVAGFLLDSRGEGEEVRTRTLTASGRVLGSDHAPVTIEYYEDFQCPACRSFTTSVAPRIEDEYVSKGVARVVFMHNPFIGPESMRAAEASECAADQGQFWEYHDALFAAQGIENSGSFADENLQAVAQELGLDMSGFNGCLMGHEHLDSVEKERRDAAERGVRVTPTIFINGTKIEGAGSYQELQRIIEQQLHES